MIRRVRLFVALHLAAVLVLYLLAWTVGHAVLPEPIPFALPSRQLAATSAGPTPASAEPAHAVAVAQLSPPAEERAASHGDALPERIELTRWAVDVAAR